MVLACALGFGCDADDNEESTDAASEADSEDGGELDCEQAPTVTYDTFGRGFLATYCDGCHGSEVTDRQDAPADVVFDDRESAQDWADRILARTAPPDGSDPTMPPVGGVTPEDTERLLVWLTCFP